jgi:Zn-dependent protease
MIGIDSRWWAAELWNSDPALLISWVAWIIGSIVLHELGHGWMAIRCGDRTPIETGHMTWNPWVHMGPTSLVMFALTGITWGLMPVNPHQLRGRYDYAKVAFAGPAMNLSLAITSLVLSGVWIGWAGGYWFHSSGVSEPLYGNMQTFFMVGVAVNLFGFAFNLLPVPPLDGSTIARTLSPSFNSLLNHPNAPVFTVIAFALLFFRASEFIFDVVFGVTHTLIREFALFATSGQAHF